MIPVSEEILLKDLWEKETMPSLSYKISGGKIIGMVDEKEALVQSIDLMLRTERFKFGIYSWNYGCELQGITGLASDLAMARAETMVSDVLTTDDRITSISNFDVEISDRQLKLKFDVKTIFGNISYEGVV